MAFSPVVDRSKVQLPACPAARWVYRTVDGDCVERLVREAGLPRLLARVLVARGVVECAESELFLRPSLAQILDPHAMKGIAEAVARIGRALDAGERIWIYGDYDVDGISAMALLHETLRELGGAVEYYIPHRLNEGYGLNAEAIEELAAEGARLIVTVDCGVTAVAEARRARELGVDLIITDHHEPGDELPETVAVINPRQPGCEYPFKHLAGVGVAFKLAHALLKARHADAARAKAFLKSLLDLVALGTVADIVPLLGENRVLVANGLALLRETQRIGIVRLCERAGLKQKLLDCGHIGYGLGPRLNAAGRTEHAMWGAELLITTDGKHATDLAERLESFNINRRSIEQEVLAEALEAIEECKEDRVMVLAGEGWHPGVLGIVASRVLHLLHRPTFIIGIDGETAKGSGRSVAGFDLHAALTACGDGLVRYGGHKMAAGLTVESKKLKEFRRRVNAYAAEFMTEEARSPVVEIDARAEYDELTLEVVKALDRLAPHGQQNPAPVVALEDWRLVEDPYVMKGRHVKLRVADPRGRTLTAVGWSMAHRLTELNAYRGIIRIAGTPTVNSWNGRETVELMMKDFQVG